MNRKLEKKSSQLNCVGALNQLDEDTITTRWFGRTAKAQTLKCRIICPKCETTFTENLYRRHKKVCKSKKNELK